MHIVQDMKMDMEITTGLELMIKSKKDPGFTQAMDLPFQSILLGYTRVMEVLGVQTTTAFYIAYQKKWGNGVTFNVHMAIRPFVNCHSQILFHDQSNFSRVAKVLCKRCFSFPHFESPRFENPYFTTVRCKTGKSKRARIGPYSKYQKYIHDGQYLGAGLS